MEKMTLDQMIEVWKILHNTREFSIHADADALYQQLIRELYKAAGGPIYYEGTANP